MVTIKLNDTNDRMLTTTVITTNDRVLRGKCGAISEKKEMSMEYYSPGGVCVCGGGGGGVGVGKEGRGGRRGGRREWLTTCLCLPLGTSLVVSSPSLVPVSILHKR